MILDKKFSKKCIEQNLLLLEKGLLIQSFGNSSIRINKNYFIIKPSGVNLKSLKTNDIPLIRISDGKIFTNKFKPSVDTPIHHQIYKNFTEINSISHTHSKFASSWAQTGKNIPILGTTHSDYSYDEIINLKYLNKSKVLKGYEMNLGIQIVNFISKLTNPFYVPGVLLSGHGVFSWGKNHSDSVMNAEIIELIAEMALYTSTIGVNKKIPSFLIKKHFFRKHGIDSYYGQSKDKLKK